jgi:hypothetical protein
MPRDLSDALSFAAVMFVTAVAATFILFPALGL